MHIFILVIIIAAIFGFFWAKYSVGSKTSTADTKIKPVFKAGFIIFTLVETCCAFPIISNTGFEPLRILILIFACIVIGKGFAVFFPSLSFGKLCVSFLLITAVGLVCRYLLEFGEVSNTLNFTTVNIISYMIVVPIICLASYKALDY